MVSEVAKFEQNLVIKCEEENISLLLSIRHSLLSYTVISKIISTSTAKMQPHYHQFS